MLNLTPHAIRVLVNGEIVTFEPSGIVARVETVETVVGTHNGIEIVERTTGEVTGLPEDGQDCIVSAMVLSAVPGREGVYAPDTGATAIRNDKGHIDHVVRLVKA